MQRPATITENGYTANFVYDDGGNRVKMQLAHNGTPQLTRYYLGQYEYDSETATERLYLGGDAYSAASVLVKDAAGSKIYYICRDYQGSITHVVNDDGSLKQELSYDPWGRLRNPATQQVYAVGTEPALFLGRGYTGHEHLTVFGLINMNARLYDPALGRFLSPDPYVQSPDNSQNFNRYSYCLNNPLRYTDPSGESFWSVLGSVFYIAASIAVTIFNPALGAMMIGAYVGGALANKNMDIGKWDFNNYQTYIGIIGGAVAGLGTVSLIGAAMQNSLAIKIGAEIGSALKATVDFAVVGGKFVMQGAGWITAAGGGAYMTYEYMKSVIQKEERMTYGDDFARELQSHYENGNGSDYFLSQERLYDIYNKALINGSFEWNKARLIADNIYQVPTNLYKTDYALSFGRATMKIYYDSSGKIYPVGFQDTWDLDSKSWGIRSIPAEIITRYYNWKLNGKNFKVKYP